MMSQVELQLLLKIIVTVHNTIIWLSILFLTSKYLHFNGPVWECTVERIDIICCLKQINPTLLSGCTLLC